MDIYPHRRQSPAVPRPRSLQFAYIQQSKEKMWDKAFGIYATLQDFFIEFL